MPVLKISNWYGFANILTSKVSIRGVPLLLSGNYSTGTDSNFSKFFSNGLLLATQPFGSRNCCLGLIVDAGSRWDAEKPGRAHFFEHVAFAGKLSGSQKSIGEEALDRGARLSAVTKRERSSFFVQIKEKSDLDWACKVLHHITQNTEFDDQVIDDTRDHIKLEMEEKESNPKDVVFDYLHATAFQGTDLSSPIIGNLSSINKIDKVDLSYYVKGHFKGPRIALVATGGLAHADLLAAANRQQFDKISALYTDSQIPIRRPARFTGSEIRDRDDALPLAHVALAVEGPPAHSVDTLVLRVANQINGHWDRQIAASLNSASRFQATMFEYGAVHHYQGFMKTFQDSSLFGYYFAAERDNLEIVIEFVQGEWMRIATECTDFEVERAKNSLKTQLVSQYHSSHGTLLKVCSLIGKQLNQLERAVPLEEMLYRVDQITSKQVRDVMHRYVYDKCIAIGCYGPVEALLDYSRIRRNMYRLRV